MGISSDVRFRNAWDDPLVGQRLREGQQPTEIWLILCPACGNYSYYNLGSHFSCSVEGCGHAIAGDELDVLIDNGDATTLAGVADRAAALGGDVFQIEPTAIGMMESMFDRLADDSFVRAGELLVRRCRVCGCTDDRACPGGCSWVCDDLCSGCES